MQQYTSVAYGQNEEHPDLEVENSDESSESSSDEDNSMPRHGVRIAAYDDLDKVR